MLLSAILYSVINPGSELAMEQQESTAIAGNMAVYRNAVTQFSRSTPGYSGVVPDASLNLPTWFRKIGGVSNYVTGGKGYVYVTGQPGVAFALYRRTESLLVGTKTGGFLVHPTQGTTAIAIPSAIPELATVYAE
ncbi:type IV pilus biogenesis protein PilM [Pseudomonas sp. JG-B]|uniref:type IV pilus biogenesis protein PilM n=1 Tax=Pseudomonas sp. JG-B TaxID=2603214 RepID=UPI00129E8FB6|nr:type IV pilus biogenesis protein PilM [Pseudomonas sp. JG-B]MRK19078.1 pilM protein [Pseudomonas sp. JG-B]